MASTKVGIREFRENLASYLESKTPIAVTRHGSTIGIYVPTVQEQNAHDWEAIVIAAKDLQRRMADAGTTEDELVEDFKRARRAGRKQKS